MAQGRFSKLETKNNQIDPSKLQPPEGTVDIHGNRDPKGSKASEANPSDPYADHHYPTFIEMADDSFFAGDYKDALRHFSRALQEDNTHIYPWIGQISALIAMKQYREAELWSNKALEQFPEDSSLLSQRARVLALTGNVKRAIGSSDFAMSKGATKWSWLARGEVLLEAKDGNSLFCFEKALEMADAEDWKVPHLAALAYARKHQWASAEEFHRKALERNSKAFFIWYAYADTLMEMSYTDRASDAVKRCLQLKPDFRPARDLETKILRRPFLKRVFGAFKR